MKAGDLIYRTDRGLVAWAIRVVTQSPINHVGMLDQDDDGSWWVLEAVRPHIRRRPLEARDHILAWSYPCSCARQKAIATMLSLVGKNYSLLSCLSDGLCWAFPWAPLFDTAKAFNCAEAVALAVGGIDYRGITPGQVVALTRRWPDAT